MNYSNRYIGIDFAYKLICLKVYCMIYVINIYLIKEVELEIGQKIRD
jgi:hypothetical protein